MMNAQFSDILRQAFTSLMADVHTAMPGKIVSYEAAKKKAKVQPLINTLFDNGESLQMPVITDVPVIMPGTTDAVVSLPIKAGDGCLLVFSEKSLENWASSQLETVDPGDPRTYALTDAFCIPGLFTLNKPGKVGTGNDLEILYKDSKVVLKDNGDVEINGNSKSFVTHTELNTAISTLMTQLNSHTHLVASLGAPTGPASASTPPVTFSCDISAAKTTTVKTGG